MLIQTSRDNGDKKLKAPGLCLDGFLINMLMAVDMNGLLNSTTFSRSAVIVSGAMAKSTSFNNNKQKMNKIKMTQIYDIKF